MKLTFKSALGAIGTTAIATTVAAITTISAPAAEAASFDFGFQNIPLANNTNGDAIVGQFSFSVTDSASGQTTWQFKNAGPTNSFIGQIYFDWKGLSSSPITSTFSVKAPGTSAGVNFSSTTGKLPQGQDVRVLGNTLGFDNSTGNQNANLAFAAVSPGSNKDGIDQGETLAVIFNSLDASSLKALLLADTLRVGMHVQGIAPNGGSDAFLDGGLIIPPPPKPVPVPGFLLGFAVAGGFGVARVIKNKKQVA